MSPICYISQSMNHLQLRINDVCFFVICQNKYSIFVTFTPCQILHILPACKYQPESMIRSLFQLAYNCICLFPFASHLMLRNVAIKTMLLLFLFHVKDEVKVQMAVHVQGNYILCSFTTRPTFETVTSCSLRAQENNLQKNASQPFCIIVSCTMHYGE